MISVIVPVFNAQDYVGKCITSILYSTFRDLEVILVDDGSTDDSGKICDYYASKDSRCIVFHTPNRGISAARNYGISLAKGDYISFADCDDFIHPCMLEYLYTALQEYQEASFSFCMCQECPPGTQIDFNTENRYKKIKRKIVSPINFAKSLYGRSGVDIVPHITVWTKLYRKALLQDIRFPEGYPEDVFFNTSLVPVMSSAIYLQEKLYYWVQRPTSVTHQKITKSRIHEILTFEDCYHILNNFDKGCAEVCIEKVFKVLLRKRREAKGTVLEQYSSVFLKPYFRLYYKRIIKIESIPWKRKCFLSIFYFSPVLYSFYVHSMEYYTRYKRTFFSLV